jgi:mxaJ protein
VTFRHSAAAVAIFAAAALAFSGATTRAASPQVLRVCADPDYMPFSNRAGEGFENVIAREVGRAMGRTVRFVWASTRTSGGFDQFLHETLNAGKCDAIMDVPYASTNVLATRPYYVSSYVFVYPKKRNYDISSLDSPVLRQLRIGYEEDTPPETGLKLRTLILHSVPFDIGDTEGQSPQMILDALTAGQVSVVVTWEPSIGYYLRDRPDLKVVEVPNSRALGAPEQYAFPMAMAARNGDKRTRDALDAVIGKDKAQLTRILERYGVRLYQPSSDVGMVR